MPKEKLSTRSTRSRGTIEELKQYHNLYQKNWIAIKRISNIKNDDNLISSDDDISNDLDIPESDSSTHSSTESFASATIEHNPSGGTFFCEHEASSSKTITSDLAGWVADNNIPHNSTDQLLKLLKNHGMTELPTTARTLLKSKTCVDIINRSGMDYFYFGLEQGLLDSLNKYPDYVLKDIQTVKLSFNIDGLPLFKSSKSSLWPILCGMYVKTYPVHVFTVALCLGQNKPANLDFMDEFIDELLEKNLFGFTFQHTLRNIKMQCFICDAPAKAMIKGIKQFNGYFGCDKCTQEGTFEGRMTYQEIDSSLRTDESFRNIIQEQHHNVLTPILKLPIDMVTSFPADYMHVCCLGVMKKMLLLWMRGERRVKLSAQQKNMISLNLIQLKKTIPSFFARKCRTLDEIDRWKATEFRQFMLYTGKLALEDILRPELYKHFIVFNVAMSILVSPTLSSTHIMYAKDLLIFFVLEGKRLYGKEFMVFNVHSLIHLADDVSKHGPLDSFSAFPYENFLQKLKKMVRSGKNPMTQIVKRIYEIQNNGSTTVKINSQFNISEKRPNNSFILNDVKCCEVVDILEGPGKDVTWRCRVYHNPESVFENPCDSRVIGTFKCYRPDAVIKIISKAENIRPAIMVLQDQSVLFLSVLHEF